MKLLLLILAVTAVSAVLRPPGYWKKRLFEKERKGSQLNAQYPWLQTLWFDQKMDHFDQYNTGTWKQKYYLNPKYDRGNGIIFLMIGGEAPESGHWAAEPTVQYLQWAAEYGALVFDLEHRFFGDSWPVPNMNTTSLRLLTSTQALADIAYFIQSMNQLHGFNNPRWVTFGGSYPGALAAWFREKYPEYTVGSVASSGVVNLKLDFYEYAMGVNDDLWVTQPDCATATKTAFQAIQNLTMTEAGRDKLNTQLHLVPPFNKDTSKLDITNLFGNLYNVYQGMSQYTYDGQNNKTETVLTDAAVCNIMTNTSIPDPVDRVYKLMMWYDEIYGDNSGNFPNSYWDAINPVSTGNLTALGEDNASARGWMWLCCNELGFMQTTDQGDNVFGSTIPLNFFIDMCTDMFGGDITMDHVYNTNWNAQKYYGGADKYYATNIVLPNGSMDPWHLLGTYFNNSTLGATSILINGTAHCSDMYPSYPGEPAALAPARAIIKGQVQTFIRYDPTIDGPKPTTLSPSSPTTTTTLSPSSSAMTTTPSPSSSAMTTTPSPSSSATTATTSPGSPANIATLSAAILLVAALLNF